MSSEAGAERADESRYSKANGTTTKSETGLKPANSDVKSGSDTKFRDEQLGYFIKETEDGYVAICERCEWATDYKNKNRHADSVAIKHARREHGLRDYGLEFKLSKYDFQLPGLGERGEDCGAQRVPESEAICPTGDSIRTEHIKCRRVECPDCYQDWGRERAFDMVLELEAYARVHAERPHALVMSVPPEETGTWDWDDINTSLFRRGYRRFRENESERVRCPDVGTKGHSVEECPGCYEVKAEVGGFSMFHPARVSEDAKEELQRQGYGSGGDKGGYWVGVREDVLDRGDWRNYVEFGPHVHNVGFPSYIQSHEGEDFLVKKYARLDGLDDTIGHVRYLLSHVGIRNGAELGNATRSWGLFHHVSESWKGAEEELSEGEYERLAERIAEELGYEWEGGELVHEGESERCPECNVSVSEFHDIWELPSLIRRGMGEPWLHGEPAAVRSFYAELSEQLMQADYRAFVFDGSDDTLVKENREREEIEEIEIPEQIVVFGDRPPP